MDGSQIEFGQVVRSVLQGLHRQWPIVAAAVLGMVTIALIYVLTATPQFTATSSIIIDPRVSSGPDTPSAPMLLLSDALVVDSEVEVLLSRELRNRVIDRLDLLNDAEAQPSTGLIDEISTTVRSFIDEYLVDESSSEEAVSAEEALQRRREDIIRAIGDALTVSRTGETYVIAVSFTSPDPVYAARIANALTEQYFLLQAEAVYENTRRVNEWLGQRVELLGQQVVAADQAVEQYKQENGLFNIQNDSLPSQVELASANDQAIAVRGTIVELETNIGQLRQIIANNALNASVDPAVRTPSLTTLQTRFAELVGRERDLSTRFGSGHQLAVRARDEIAATRTQIVEEFQKIVAAESSRLATLRAQDAENQTRIAALRVKASEDAQKMIRLRELEREATSSRTLYESMLGKLNETTQAESFKSAPARVIARAVPPDRKSAPQGKVILALGILGGLVIGAGGAFLREQLDDVFRSATSPEDELGTPLLGLIPNFAIDRRMARRSGHTAPTAAASREKFGDLAELARNAASYRFAVDHPMSMFTETLRALSFAVNSARSEPGASILGITSTEAGEGKSTLSSNFASYMASVGNRVALIDFDFRNPSLTRVMRGSNADQYLGALLKNPHATAGLVANPVLEGACFIGNDGKAMAYDPSDVGFAKSMDIILANLRRDFDLVILDLPPLANLVDARAASNVVDHVVLAIEWGRTKPSLTRSVVYSSPQLRSRLIGAIYTKVKLAAYNKYNSQTPSGYYNYPH
ncbi:GNVR domain-containing protein [Aurantimonas sp. Leaf443]|uniref:GumC family protein n=1 Tax=Aurantimonas sp. Leaf443 TaxID=1736378 RepID=UPI0006FDC253|nr:GNVR domain-containing protein [Aurantimonas sp. Leaf443]KQT85075.1 hypothetical protein ASG48_07245 [Aurantimonas sp. Leaf443]